jgi:hypothetical protein
LRDLASRENAKGSPIKAKKVLERANAISEGLKANKETFHARVELCWREKYNELVKELTALNKFIIFH